jgi:DNA modification methylase
MAYETHLGSCIAWMRARAPNSIHAIVTDPPYGMKEFTAAETKKLRAGKGGVWRIPPSFDGCKRSPLPRFTVLTEKERAEMTAFFAAFAVEAIRVLTPGAHLFVAGNPLLSHLVYQPMIAAGFEKRGEVIRLVQTLRGGDRPKNAHKEFPDVTVMPRSAWEPWGLFRKPCEGRVQDNLRKWKTGGLRRPTAALPFADVIPSSPTRPEERALAPHPSLKPQAFMRQLVRASLPLGEGVVFDPRWPSATMPSGSSLTPSSTRWRGPPSRNSHSWGSRVSIERNRPDAKRFNRDAQLPFELRLDDFAIAMQDVYDFFYDVNVLLTRKGLQRLDEVLRPAIMSGVLSDMLTASLAKHSRTLVQNRYFNGHPDLVVQGVYAKDAVKAGEEGVEIKTTRKSGGAVDTHGARDQWMCVFVYDLDNETEPAKDRAPMTFTEVYLGHVTVADFRKNARGELGTRTATLDRHGIAKLRSSWIYLAEKPATATQPPARKPRKR